MRLLLTLLFVFVGANTVENQIISGKAVAETILKVLRGEDVSNRLV